MNGLIDGAIGRARMVLAILLVALIAGSLTYMNLPKEADPDIPIPFVGVTIPLEGVSPEDAERLLVRPVESELQGIEGVKQIDSFALEGAGQIIIEFDVSFDQDQAVLDVREKVDLAEREFPDEAREPVITEINASLFPILAINLYGDAPERELFRLGQDLKDELEGLQGVLEARLQGDREEVLEIVVDPAKLEAYNISYQDILATVANNNRLVPAGRIDMGQGRFPVKVPGLIKTAEDAFDLPVLAEGDATITLADVSTVRRTFKDREEFAKFNGQPSISLQIIKRTGANILDTVADVEAVIEQSRDRWPSSINVTLTSDMSEMIDEQLGQLQASIAVAVVLVMIIVVAALGLRSAGMVGLAIPGSFVMAFLMLGVFGYTINLMVMFGMVIAVGILVDGAIVVVEYADRKMAEGLHRKQAYGMAAKRMFWPIVASSATTLAAFFPFLFWDSLVGKFMSYLPITLIFVLVASLVMALIFLPVLGSVVGKRSTDDTNQGLAGVSGVDGDPLEASGWFGRYARATSALINRPFLVTAGAAALVISIFMWFGSTSHKSELFLDVEPEQLYVFVQAQGNLSADEEYAIVDRVVERLLPLDGIESMASTSGSEGSGSFNFDGVSSPPQDTIGRVLINLKDRDDGYDGRVTEQNIRNALVGVPGLRTEVRKLEQGPPVGKDVQIALKSNNGPALLEAAAQVRAFVDSMDGLREVEDSRPLPGIEYRLEVDRAQAGKFGIDVSQVGAAVQLVTNGILVGRYRPDDALDEIDIRVRFPEAERSVEALDRLRIATPEGQVPLSQFVTREPAPKVTKIERRDGKRVIMVRANAVEQGAGAAKVAEVKDWLETANLNPAVDVQFEGADEDAAEASAFFQVAALSALFLMGIILLWEFNNFYHVLLTLSAVVLSTAGVLIGIQLVLPYISILMIGTGVVALAGIVVNNNIVLIDTFQRLQRDGRTSEQAAIAAAAQRIRPILLTTLTTICGLLPMVFMMNVNFADGSISFGGITAEWWVPLATAVVFGLGFSTMLTLIVTPVWLAAPAKMGRWRDRMYARVRGKVPTSVTTIPDPTQHWSAPDADTGSNVRPAAE
ncbi:efflux RND transporter permease subunit [Hyphomonas sp. FCG-A18]|uniref:efflux RND transporter permease subunit n=1 Tax=Hyphomonas sp. FCG-A18 TaxID=3080019 RepID=UPI002B30D2A5|nr:efflux RND transporter permease subunit [Hyphomonas sp. FCG-A18]